MIEAEPFWYAIRRRLASLSPVTLIVLCTAMIGLIGMAESFASDDAAIFYLIPISLATWYGSRSLGSACALVSASIWFIANYGLQAGSGLGVYWHAGSRFGFFLVTIFLLDRLRIELQRAEALARTDPLTGAANGRAFYETVGSEIRRMARNPRPLTLAYLDLDNFKEVNDLLGHSTGDQLLCVVVKTLHEHLRQTDVIARLGGDEFAIFLPETPQEGAMTLLGKLNDLLLQTMIDKNWPVTCSMGVVTFPMAPESVDRIIQRADALLYAAKRGGKNQIRYETVGTGNGGGAASVSTGQATSVVSK